MENTTEAFIIAVNVLVFVTALSAAMLLMQNVNNMVEYARTSIEQDSGGSLMQQYEDVNERTFSGAEVYALYGEQLEDEQKNNNILIRTNTATYTLKQFIAEYGTSYLSETFVLVNEKENEFIFELKTNDIL